MKKYLMSGVAAIAFLAVVTSCSKSTDLYDQDAQNLQKELVVNKNYAAAFEKAFGTVGSNVDWGFSSKIAKVRGITRSVGTYAGYRGSLEPTISFPEDAPASNFLDAVPTGVEKLPADGGGPKSWYIDESTTSVSTWAGASKIYVTGNVDLSGTDAFAPSITSEIYLASPAVAAPLDASVEAGRIEGTGRDERVRSAIPGVVAQHRLQHPPVVRERHIAEFLEAACADALRHGKAQYQDKKECLHDFTLCPLHSVYG